MNEKYLKIAVIGGGAAGFFGAITCAENFPEANVTIFEKGQSVLSKVRVSGGGRCNVTHSCFEPRTLVKNYPRGDQELLGPFHKFQPLNTRQWFEQKKVSLKTESDGRMFPTTDSSQTIIDALTNAAIEANVKVRTGTIINLITKIDDQFHLKLSTGEEINVDRVLIATGSHVQGYEWAKALGHSITPPVPSLFTFNILDNNLRSLSGVSTEKATVKILGTNLQQSGPLLITHWGLSGPAVLKLSAWGARILYEKNYEAEIEINWTSITPAEIEKLLKKEKIDQPKKAVINHPLFKIPKRLWEYLVLKSEISKTDQWANISNEKHSKLLKHISACPYQIKGKSTFKEEFVTCGGVRLDEINFQTMESRKTPHLYFAGEILDIDGVTGGFNFQNAWTTGWLAGKAMGKST